MRASSCRRTCWPARPRSPGCSQAPSRAGAATQGRRRRARARSPTCPARRRARWFLHAYRVALFAFWDACAQEAERLRLPRSASYALARTVIKAIDVVTTQAAEGFLREDARVRTRSGREARGREERPQQALPFCLHPGHPPHPVGSRPRGSRMVRASSPSAAANSAGWGAASQAAATSRSASAWPTRSRRSHSAPPHTSPTS